MTINVDGVVYYRVQNATLAVANITNVDSATRLLAQTTLRNVLGTKNLSQILSDREEIAHSMQVWATGAIQQNIALGSNPRDNFQVWIYFTFPSCDLEL